jgi:hypothetical protein
MVKKNIDWIDTDDRLTAKTSIRSMVVRRKNILNRWIDTIGQKSIFLLMTNTIVKLLTFLTNGSIPSL